MEHWEFLTWQKNMTLIMADGLVIDKVCKF